MASGMCDVCEKTPAFGRNIRHQHSGRWERKAPKQSRTFQPNVNKQRVMIDGAWHRTDIGASACSIDDRETAFRRRH